MMLYLQSHQWQFYRVEIAFFQHCHHQHPLSPVDTGNDEEDSGTLGSSFSEPTESEYDCSLVLLHHLTAEGGSGLRDHCSFC